MLKFRSHPKSKSLKVVLLLLLTHTLLSPVIVYAADQLVADSDDKFSVSSPVPNSTVGGEIEVKWSVYDDDQDPVEYQLSLFESNCENKLGTIVSGSVPRARSVNSSIDWPTYGPIQGMSRVSDGRYCIQMCVSLLDGSTPYSACNLRRINIRNLNSPPVINSAPPQQVELEQDESWEYQLKATDPDGDKVLFRLQQSPNFVRLNSSTGLISIDSATKNVGDYDVVIVAEDSSGLKSTQEFKIKIIESTEVTPPVDPDPDPDPEVTVRFIFPTKDSVISGSNNSIQWDTAIENGEVLSQDLLYRKIESATDDEWVVISNLDALASRFDWNITNISSGTYQLQVQTRLNDGTVMSTVSDTFSVANDQGQNNSVILITNVNPEDLVEITERQPVISGEFTPPVNSSVDTRSFSIFVGESDITAFCEITELDFSCTPDRPLNLGAHLVSVQVSDLNGNTVEREWSFVIVTQTDTEGGVVDNSGITRSTLSLIALICCVALILILVPWFLYNMWVRDKDDALDPNTIEVNTYDQAEVIDPTQFSSYEEYFSAANDNPATTIDNYYATPEYTSTTTVTETTNSGVSTPDYGAYEDSFAESTAAVAAEPVVVEVEDPNNPSWLNPVNNSDPLPPSVTTAQVAEVQEVQKPPEVKQEVVVDQEPETVADLFASNEDVIVDSSTGAKTEIKTTKNKKTVKQNKIVEPDTKIEEGKSVKVDESSQLNSDGSTTTTKTTTTTQTTTDPDEIDPFNFDPDSLDDDHGSFGYGMKEE